MKTIQEKEKLLTTSNFSFSYSVFYPFEELSAMFIKFEIVVCKLFQFGKSLVWERIKPEEADTSKQGLSQLQYMSKYCANFQKNRSKTAGVCNTKFKEFDMCLEKTRCVCETRMPLKRPFFEKCNLYI